MLSKSITNNLKQSPDWQALAEVINMKIAELDSLEGIDFSDKEKAAVQGQGKIYAKSVLEAILEPFLQEEPDVINKKKETAGKTGVL